MRYEEGEKAVPGEAAPSIETEQAPSRLNERTPELFEPQELRSVRRPEICWRDVRQAVDGASDTECRDGLRVVSMPEEVCARVIQGRARLQVICPVSDRDDAPGPFVRFNGVLVDGGVDQAQIVEDLGCLRALTGSDSGHRHNAENDGCYDDHDFHEGEALAAFV